MTRIEKPLVVSAPHPRSLDLVFSDEARARLFDTYEVIECDPGDVAERCGGRIADVRYVIGQPPISAAMLERMHSLRCVFNVESNLVANMPYERLFARGIHTVTTGLVFAEPVAEMGIAMALALGREVISADRAFRAGTELWGRHGNQTARQLVGAEVGIIGFGDLGKAVNRMLSGFRVTVRACDPWLPPSILQEHSAIPASLPDVLRHSDFVFVTASVTTENKGFLSAADFAAMRDGASFILLSRADVVDFDDLMAAAHEGRIRVASDVYPEEPLPGDHPVRAIPDFLLSAHRAGGLPAALRRMGDMVLEDMELIDRGLPPMRCKRAERETAIRMRSKGVT